MISSKEFNELKKYIEVQKKFYSAVSRTIPLKWDEFEKWMRENDQERSVLDEEDWVSKKFTVENHAGDKELFRNNAYAKEINDVWLLNIAGDIYIEEAFAVLLDLINLQKTTQN